MAALSWRYCDGDARMATLRWRHHGGGTTEATLHRLTGRPGQPPGPTGSHIGYHSRP